MAKSQEKTKKNWILGVTGGIAAYKSPDLIRMLKNKCHFDVRVVMSSGAKEFVTPMTLQAVSGHPTHDKLFDTEFEAAMGHISLAKWADNILIAPCTANRLAALAHGFADDLLSTLCLATKAQVWIAPAMNQQMWAHPSVQHNLNILESQGAHILGPEYGIQACGDNGWGRMLEPENIIKVIQNNGCSNSVEEPIWAEKKILITAGPTREYLDPVRFLSNKSSGKMGYALALAARDLGAEVTVVSGPVQLSLPSDIKLIHVESANQMHEQVMLAEKPDVFISCAAVADFRFEETYEHKIKKQDDDGVYPLCLAKNIDILSSVAAQRQKPFCVGFAAETQNIEVFAKQKLINKKIDMIAVNDVSQKDIGFDSDDNQLNVLTAHGKYEISKASKYVVAMQLLKKIREEYDTQNTA
tara:strand:- start:51182 stop:52420 length:1239 start_codon:yes stop_codon:yes gene_type:complete